MFRSYNKHIAKGDKTKSALACTAKVKGILAEKNVTQFNAYTGQECS
jgi:hypothetical protein